MRLTAIFPDRFLSVNGVGFTLPALAAHDPTVRAIQWDGDNLRGSIERASGAEPFKDPALVAPYLDLWRMEMQRRISETQAAQGSEIERHARHVTEESERQVEREKARLAQEAEDAKRAAEREAAKLPHEVEEPAPASA